MSSPRNYQGCNQAFAHGTDASIVDQCSMAFNVDNLSIARIAKNQTGTATQKELSQ
jgi:hypothetical protein